MKYIVRNCYKDTKTISKEKQKEMGVKIQSRYMRGDVFFIELKDEQDQKEMIKLMNEVEGLAKKHEEEFDSNERPKKDGKEFGERNYIPGHLYSQGETWRLPSWGEEVELDPDSGLRICPYCGYPTDERYSNCDNCGGN